MKPLNEKLRNELEKITILPELSIHVHKKLAEDVTVAITGIIPALLVQRLDRLRRPLVDAFNTNTK